MKSDGDFRLEVSWEWFLLEFLVNGVTSACCATWVWMVDAAASKKEEIHGVVQRICARLAKSGLSLVYQLDLEKWRGVVN